jgi:hypothetical protein
MCIASIMQTWYLCLFHTQVYCIVCIFPHVTHKCVVLTLSIPRHHLELSKREVTSPSNLKVVSPDIVCCESNSIHLTSNLQSCQNLFPVCQTIGLADVDNVSDLSSICRTYIFFYNFNRAHKEKWETTEKWRGFWEKLIAINRNIVSQPL